MKFAKSGETLYKLNKQKSILFDFNSETPGHNRKPGEPIKDYIKRVMDCDYLYYSNDFGLYDCCPVA